jgi:hypothetical protein
MKKRKDLLSLWEVEQKARKKAKESKHIIDAIVGATKPIKHKPLKDMKPKFQGKVEGFSQADIDHFNAVKDQISEDVFKFYPTQNHHTKDNNAVKSNQSIFEEGAQIVDGPRHEDYGDFHHNMKDIALVWSGILGVRIKAKEVALCMAGLKLVRESNKHKRDNGVDAVGYMGIAHEIGEREQYEEEF